MDITKRLQDKAYSLMHDAGLVIQVTDKEWQAIVDLYKSRGDGEPVKPVFQGIPIVREEKE